MGTLSRQDEHAMLIGCGTLLLGVGALLAGIGFLIFKLAQWVFA
jgi:hypothetical protein